MTTVQARAARDTGSLAPRTGGHRLDDGHPHDDGDEAPLWPPLTTSLSLAGQAVLLATDGSDEAAAATRFALALSLQKHVEVNALGVTDTRFACVSPPLDLPLQDDGPALAQVAQEKVGETITSVLGHAVDWPVNLVFGEPSHAIAAEAAARHAAMVVLGLRPRGRLQRAFHVEAILQVSMLASCPVIGVDADTRELPSRILVALDFGRASLEAARAARSLLAPGGVLILAYVAPQSFYETGDGEKLIHDLGVQRALAALAHELDSKGATIRQVVLEHERPATVGSTLLAFAARENVDLIAAGSVHHGLLDRWMLGSVSTDLVHDAACSILIMPPR